MKKYILVTLLLSISVSFLSAQQQGATISFDDEGHNFGEIKESDGPVTYEFIFSNTGSTPLVLTNVKASCGCTTPTWSKEPIRPGEKGFVKVAYNPRNRPGGFNKTVTVTTNATPPRKVLRISGEVLPRVKTVEDIYPRMIGTLRMKTNHLAFVKVYTDQVKVDSLPIINVGEEPIKLTFQSDFEHVKLYTVPSELKPRQKGHIVGEYDGSKKNNMV